MGIVASLKKLLSYVATDEAETEVVLASIAAVGEVRALDSRKACQCPRLFFR